MPDSTRQLEYRLGVLGLIILGLSVPVIVYKNAGWTWTFITVFMVAAFGIQLALTLVIRRGRRQAAEVEAIRQRVVQSLSAASQGAIRRMPEGERRSRPQNSDLTRVIEHNEAVAQSIPLMPGRTGPVEVGITKIRVPEPKPEPEPRTAWQRILED